MRIVDELRDHGHKPGRVFGFVVGLGLLTLTALLVERAHRHSQSRSLSEATTTAPLTAGTIEIARTEAVQPSTSLAARKSPQVTILAMPRSRLRIDQIIGSSTDLMSLLRNALPDAWRGDMAAQYYASTILRACGDDLPSSTLEDRREQVARLRQASQLSASALNNIEESADRCKDVWEAARSDIGFGGDWLMKAAQGGFPQAMLDQATSIDPAISRDQRESFLQAAINSGDPDVMRSIAGEFFSADAESSAKNLAAAALVACDFGADCGSGSDQLLALLPTTSSEDAPERGLTVQEWIDRDLGSAAELMLQSQASDFAARARNNQLGVTLNPNENDRFELSFTSAANGGR